MFISLKWLKYKPEVILVKSNTWIVGRMFFGDVSFFDKKINWVSYICTFSGWNYKEVFQWILANR